MKIYRIAIIIKQDPKLLEGARLVVEENKMIGEIADSFHLNIEDLSDAVLDLRKTKSLPVNLILELYQKYQHAKTVENKLRKNNLNISEDDIVWAIRRNVPNAQPSITKNEAEKILSLLDQGKTRKEISEKMWISEAAIHATIKRLRPETVNSPTVDDKLAQTILNSYIDLTTHQNKTFQEAMSLISFDLGIDIRKIRDVLNKRGLNAGKVKKPFTTEEKEAIIKELSNGANFSDVAKTFNRNHTVIRQMVEREYPALYQRLKKIQYTVDNIPINIRNLVVSLAKQNKSAKEIQEALQNSTLNATLATGMIYNIKKRWLNRPLMQFVVDEISEAKSNDLILKDFTQEYNDTTTLTPSIINRIRTQYFPNDTATINSIQPQQPTTPKPIDDWTNPNWKDPKKKDPSSLGLFTTDELNTMKKDKVASNWYQLYKLAINVYRGDSSPISINDFNPEFAIKELGKELGSAAAWGPGIYFVTQKDIAQMYGQYITQKSLNNTNILTKQSPKFNYQQINSILQNVNQDMLNIAVSNWDENYNKGKQALIQSILNNDNPLDQLMAIWADVFTHQNANNFIELMIKNNIDGISINKDDATYYVIYNKNILK